MPQGKKGVDTVATLSHRGEVDGFHDPALPKRRNDFGSLSASAVRDEVACRAIQQAVLTRDAEDLVEPRPGSAVDGLAKHERCAEVRSREGADEELPRHRKLPPGPEERPCMSVELESVAVAERDHRHLDLQGDGFWR